MSTSWQPSANFSSIKERAILLNQIRDFFKQQNVLEVETPLLCQYAPTSLHIDPMIVTASGNKLRFLQTSPEYAMKRLIAAGCGDIYQLCKAFREEEVGTLHNPEFTMLEWYRVGFNHHQLMQDIEMLLKKILFIDNNDYTCTKISYKEIFIKYLNIDPILATIDSLKKLVINNIELSDHFKNFMLNGSKADYQMLLFSNCIEPYLSKDNQILFVYNYPVEQAALANIASCQEGGQIAERFEVYVNGIEIANGYHELLDATIQKNRFLEDQKLRQKLKKPHLAIDPYLIAALKYGMPDCSGVALGIDRLLMLKTNSKSIKDILCFPWNLA